MQFLKRFFKNQSGATAIEYGLIAALIAVAAITILQSFAEKPAVSEEATMKVTEEVPVSD